MDCIKKYGRKNYHSAGRSGQTPAKSLEHQLGWCSKLRKTERLHRKTGFFKPILARELDGGQFEILGGEHRWRAAMEQGISTVPVISVGKISDLVAKQMSLVDNERYGEDDQVALQRLIEEIQSELDYQLSEIAPYDDELAATLARESAIDLEMLEALSRGDEEPIEKDSREKAERVGAEHQTMRFKVTFDASDRVTETIKSIIKEQAINTGNDMENAGEALVWLVDNYKECI